MLVGLASMYQTKYGSVLWWPTTVTAKPKTSRRKQNTSRQNQVLHSKNKKALVLPWVFAFAVRYLVFAVKYLVLPWGIWFCREVFGFAVTVVGHRTVQFTFSGGKISVRVYPCWICCPLRHFIRYVCSKSGKSNNYFSQPLLSAFSCGLRYFSAQSRFSYLVYRLPRFQSK